MTTTTAATGAVLAPIEPRFSHDEQAALAGLLAGYTALTRDAYTLDLRQYTRLPNEIAPTSPAGFGQLRQLTLEVPLPLSQEALDIKIHPVRAGRVSWIGAQSDSHSSKPYTVCRTPSRPETEMTLGARCRYAEAASRTKRAGR
ncbi:MAG TPA: hypothetical protein VGJ59_24810 [Jatrophihabitantaceae bacterium]|jgi:hypothetical protein